MGHELRDRVSMELARRIASGLADHPEWIELARGNLRRWRARNADAPGLVRCYDEWLDLLERPATEVAKLLVEESDRGQWLRQNSPFAGVLTPREVWASKQRCRGEAKST